MGGRWEEDFEDEMSAFHYYFFALVHAYCLLLGILRISRTCDIVLNQWELGMHFLCVIVRNCRNNARRAFVVLFQKERWMESHGLVVAQLHQSSRSSFFVARFRFIFLLHNHQL